MAVIAGKRADFYIASDDGISMTGEATSSLGSNVYQITNASKRAINPNAPLSVWDDSDEVPPQNYSVSYGTGKIQFIDGFVAAGSITVDGEYLTLSQCAQGDQWQLDIQNSLEEIQVFGGGWKVRAATLRESSATFERFYLDEYFHDNLGKYFVVALYTDYANNKRFIGAFSANSNSITTPENGVIRENVQFVSHGGIDYVEG